MNPKPLRSRLTSWGSSALLLLATVGFFGPLWFMFAGSLRSNEKVLTLGWQALLPVDVTLDNYRAVFRQLDFTHFFLNSLLIVGSVVVAGLLVNSLTGHRLQVRVIAIESMGHDQILYFDAGVPTLATAPNSDRSDEALLPKGSFTARLSSRFHARPGETLELAVDVSRMHLFTAGGKSLG